MLHRDFKWASGYWTEEDVLYSIKDIIRLVGPRNVYENTHAFIKIEDGRGIFPSDVCLVDTVAFVNGVSTIEEALECDDDLQFIPMRWMTDKLHRTFHTSTQDYYIKSNLTYTLNNNFIFCNIESGIACCFYQKLATDDQGFLKIPNNIAYLHAIVWDIAKKSASNMYMWDKLTRDKFDHICQMRSFKISQAGNSTKIPGLDERATIKNANLSWPNEINPESNFHLNMYKARRIG